MIICGSKEMHRVTLEIIENRLRFSPVAFFLSFFPPSRMYAESHIAARIVSQIVRERVNQPRRRLHE